MQAIKGAFIWDDEAQNDTDYPGWYVTRLDDGSIKLDQNVFASTLQISPIPRERSTGTGCLQWLAATRPLTARQAGSTPFCELLDAA